MFLGSGFDSLNVYRLVLEDILSGDCTSGTEQGSRVLLLPLVLLLLQQLLLVEQHLMLLLGELVKLGPRSHGGLPVL